MYLLTKYCKKFFRKGRTFLKYSSTEVEKKENLAPPPESPPPAFEKMFFPP